MRISENSQYRDALANLEETSTTLAKFQTQVSSGKRLNQPSDDPRAAGADSGVHAQLDTLNRYTTADQAASSRLSVADSALGDIINQLVSARTAAQSAAGSPVSDLQRQAAVATLQSVKLAIVSDLNTTYQGTYLFGGTKSTTVPFTMAGNTVSAYQGNASTMKVDVGSQTSVDVTLDGSTVTQGSDASDVFAHIDALITAVQNGDSAGITAGMQSLADAHTRAVSAQTAVGTSLNRLASQSARLSTMTTAVESQISALEDTDMAQAIIDLQKSQTAEQSALGALATTAQRKTLMDFLA